MEYSSTNWIPEISDWWHQEEETYPKYTNLSNVAQDILSIIPHVVAVEASVSHRQDVISRRESITIWETLDQNLAVRQVA